MFFSKVSLMFICNCFLSLWNGPVQTQCFLHHTYTEHLENTLSGYAWRRACSECDFPLCLQPPGILNSLTSPHFSNSLKKLVVVLFSCLYDTWSFFFPCSATSEPVFSASLSLEVSVFPWISTYFVALWYQLFDRFKEKYNYVDHPAFSFY